MVQYTVHTYMYNVHALARPWTRCIERAKCDLLPFLVPVDVCCSRHQTLAANVSV